MLKAMLNIPIEARRTQLEAMTGRAEVPSDIEIEEVEAGGVSCEWVRATGGTPRLLPGVIVYLHAGWYTMGSARTDRSLTTALARVSGREVLSVNYRLAPEHPFPAALEDTLTVYRWLLTTGRVPGSIIFVGSSAGGGLATATLVSLRDAGDSLPAGAILLSPVTDWAVSGASHLTNAEIDLIDTPELITEMRTCYLGESDPRTPLASPLYADLHGLPPLLIHVGSDELLLDDSTQLAERARAAGVPVTLQIGDGMWHNWHMTAARIPFPEGQAAMNQLWSFIDQVSGKPVS